MKYHINITLEKWNSLPFLKRMGNIGSEVIRAIKWKNKCLKDADLAFLRSLELFDITIDSELTKSQLKEVCRAREFWVDFYKYNNDSKTDSIFWENYFNYLTVRSLI